MLIISYMIHAEWSIILHLLLISTHKLYHYRIGIPFEGNYSGWLAAKNKRLEEEKKSQSAAAKAVAAELEWVRSNPKAQGNKSKARLKRYDELLAAAAPQELRQEGQIYIPPGPRLGDVVIDVNDLKKSFDSRLLIDGLEFSLPAGKCVLFYSIFSVLQS